jgi:23S rRNA pseudouridine1911/1915/1917 synthase
MIKVVYEDQDVVVIDKPAGVLVHEAEGTGESETVVDWFLAHVPSAQGVGEPKTLADGSTIERSGVVHRLDRETSGVMILAKHQDAFLHLKQQFHDRQVFKEYRAFVHGVMLEKWGTVDRPIGRSSKDFRLRSAQRGARGMLRPAVTDWELIGEDGTHSYIKVHPKTGRTHQIRVHLKAINRPIICDALYAPNQPCELGFQGLALHAHILGLTLPSGEVRRFMSPLPQVFVDAADRMSEEAGEGAE